MFRLKSFLCLLGAKEKMMQDDAGRSIRTKLGGVVMHQTSSGPPPRRCTVLKQF